VGFSLQARKEALVLRFKISCTLHQFRSLYREHAITRQRMVPRLGGQKLPSQEAQAEQIQKLLMELEEAIREGRELLIADESLFSPNSYDRSRHWAPRGQPIRKLRKFAPERPVMVCGVIGPTMGSLYYHVGSRSFNALDMHEVLKEVR